MGRRVEKGGCAAELTDDLETVYRGPQRQKLKRRPVRMAEAPDFDALSNARAQLEKQRKECRVRAREWVSAGASASRAPADADPQWRDALEDGGVALTDDPDEDGLFARAYAGFDGRTLTQLVPEELIPYRDLLMREERWEPDGLFPTGVPDPSGGELPFPEQVIAAHADLEELTIRTVRALRHATMDWDFSFKKDIDDVLHGLAEETPALLTTFLDEMADFVLRKVDKGRQGSTRSGRRTATSPTPEKRPSPPRPCGPGPASRPSKRW